MAIRTFTSRAFNHNVSEVKKASEDGPVFITNRGRPSHVLLTVDAYRELVGEQQIIVDLLALPAAGDIDSEPARLVGPLYRPVDLS